MFITTNLLFISIKIIFNLVPNPSKNSHSFKISLHDKYDLYEMIHMKFHHSYFKLFIIHFACCLKLTEVLIEHGCNVNARNFQGDTALHVMVKRNRLSCAVVLLSHNAYTDIQNADGNTPLHLAVKVM